MDTNHYSIPQVLVTLCNSIEKTSLVTLYNFSIIVCFKNEFLYFGDNKTKIQFNA